MHLEVFPRGQFNVPHTVGRLHWDAQQNVLLAAAHSARDYFLTDRLSWMIHFLFSYTISTSMLGIITAATQLWILRHKEVKVLPSYRMCIQMVSIDISFTSQTKHSSQWEV
ncbi:hypothetical protein BDV26DRAFT_262480 [Aspergillus bertholletiae]|uniref:Uncharacterized protein n=1 Tax=Aspergillus bertholletiae TaxID=1226010 RepID=A0A5N7B892_9EURO|nr:hypothetical protein BDV26DRAFT_262480 [Aspergillus bertholletiae]